MNTAYTIACHSVIAHVLFVALQKLASSDDEDVSKEASGALWELGEHKEKATEKTAGGKQGTGVCTHSMQSKVSRSFNISI